MAKLNKDIPRDRIVELLIEAEFEDENLDVKNNPVLQ